jgi:hypothetical protein
MDFLSARTAFFRECIVDDATLVAMKTAQYQSGFLCIHLRTSGEDNVLVASEQKPILKHLFLQNSRFRSEVIEHYRNRGFSWVDVVCLNRTQWKIFLWSFDSTQQPHVAPFLFNFQSMQQVQPMQQAAALDP